MKRSNRLIILLGIFLAVIGGLGTMVVLNSSSGGGGIGGSSATPTPTAEPVTTVVIAKTDINLGDKITAAMVGVTKMTISQQEALGTDTFSDVNQVIGRIAGGKITSGQVLVASRDFLSPGTMADGQDIAGAVASGMLGVTMEVDQVNGVGTLLVPGDHVDVVLSVWMDQFGISGGKTSGGSSLEIKSGTQVTTKMVIQNRKILATLLPPPDTTTSNATAAPKGSAGPAPKATSALVQNTGRHMLVILEVKPDEAEILRWAQREEKTDPQNYIDLSLALRSDQDNDLPNANTPGITFKMLVDKYGVLPPDPRAVLPPDIARGVSW